MSSARPALTALTALTALASLGGLAGCTANAAPLAAASGSSAAPSSSPPSSPPAARPGHDLPSTAKPDRDLAAITVLRAKGQAGLAEILRAYDAAPAARKAALAATADAVAAQRYATASRLYWYTDPAAAQAEAKRRQRPILALRMLGRLDEDLSCANSRFFRTALYPDARVARLLRDEFVLLWTSEREVPRVTIDYGDGRQLLGTVTGNSMHVVLDGDGRILDALPGLYAPEVFVRELTAALELARGLTGATAEERKTRLLTYWEQKLQQIWQDFGKAEEAVWDPARRQLFAAGEPATELARAQQGALSKARVEVRLIQQIAAGTDPGSIDEGDVARWASIGQAMFGIGEVHVDAPAEREARRREAARLTDVAGAPVAPVAKVARGPRPLAKNGVPPRAITRVAPAGGPRQPASPPHVLDAGARQLVASLFAEPAAPGAPGQVTYVAPAVRKTAVEPAGADLTAARVARFEQRMVADTALAQARLRPPILMKLVELGEQPAGPDASASPVFLDGFYAWVYDNVFATPRGDAWLGLLPRDEVTGLPGDGALQPR